MRRLATAALLVCLLIPTARAQNLAQSLVDMLTPSIWSVGITVARWMMKEERRVFYVEVTAQGRTFAEAQDQAMRMAVERAVGAVVSSQATATQGRLSTDDIIVYSAGFVDNHEVVEHQTVGNLAQIRMRIWVSHSRLADRLLGQSRDSGQIEGGRIAGQIATFQTERSSGDRLLLSVLKDFPQHSFKITLEPTRVFVNQQRQTILQVPFMLIWDQNYVNSLAETIRRINQRSDCDGWLSNCAQTITSVVRLPGATGWFDDTVAHDLVHQEMVISRPVLRLKLLDRVGTTKYEQCFGLAELDHSDWTNWNFVSVSGYRIQINAAAHKKSAINIDLSALPVQHLDRAEIDVIRYAHCPKRHR